MTERHSPSGEGHGLELHVNYIYDDITLWQVVDNQRKEIIPDHYIIAHDLNTEQTPLLGDQALWNL